MSNSHSLGLVLASSQFTSITDGSQTGLDITGDITIEGWIKLTQLSSTAGSSFVLQSKYELNNQRSYMAYVLNTDDKARFQWNDDGTTGSNMIERSNAAFFVADDVGVWVHFAFSLDVSAKAAIMYKNTSPVASTLITDNNSVTIHNGTAPFAIGMRPSSGTPGEFPDAKVNSMRIFSDVRSAAEIAANWKTETPAGDNLQGSWYYNEDHLDDSGNGNTLVATGSPVFSTDIPYPEAPPTGNPVSGLQSKYWGQVN